MILENCENVYDTEYWHLSIQLNGNVSGGGDYNFVENIFTFTWTKFNCVYSRRKLGIKIRGKINHRMAMIFSTNFRDWCFNQPYKYHTLNLLNSILYCGLNAERVWKKNLNRFHVVYVLRKKIQIDQLLFHD